jgi:hypothetical protein
LTLVLACLGTSQAFAQFPDPPAPGTQGGIQVGQPPGSSPFDRGAPPVGQSPFERGAPPVSGPGFSGGGGPARAGLGGRGGEPPCFKDFMPLREEAQKRANAVQAAGKRKAPPAEACRLIGNFVEAEARVVKFVEREGSSCGIPGEVLKQMKGSHAQSLELRKKVCDAAQNQAQRPTGPSLSDALGTTRLPDAAASKKPGRDTFDTLTGNVLAR